MESPNGSILQGVPFWGQGLKFVEPEELELLELLEELELELLELDELDELDELLLVDPLLLDELELLELLLELLEPLQLPAAGLIPVITMVSTFGKPTLFVAFTLKKLLPACNVTVAVVELAHVVHEPVPAKA